MQRSGKFKMKMAVVCTVCKHEWNIEVPSEQPPKCPKCGKPALPKKP
jgi:ssDNA-binding Zn-finger/Zn-ribbon topoisomerase 1